MPDEATPGAGDHNNTWTGDTMDTQFDVIVIGSGFGGAVSAARLAEAGKKVLVLERGRRWDPEDYPRGPGDAWFYDVNAPQQQHGWMDLRLFGPMSVAMCAGVGGGSLIYGNVSIVPPRATFDRHWPAAIKYDELQPFYAEAGRVLNVQEMPENQVPPRYHAMKKGAEAIGAGDRFKRVPLAVTFDPDYDTAAPNRYEPAASKTWTNEFGREQGTCNHCGFCCSGCKVRAKNTLDLNYLAIAENHGAEIRPLHLVDGVRPVRGGYEVAFRRIHGEQLIAGTVRAPKVIVAAGSLGSTEILLRSRDELNSLPRISDQLGVGWSSNGDFLTLSTHQEEMVITRGPTISCAVDFLDGSYEGAKIFIEDGALGDVPNAYLSKALRQARRWGHPHWYKHLIGKALSWCGKHSSVPHLVAWFAQSVDAANGHLVLKRPWYAPWRKELHVDWNVKQSQKTFDAVHALHEKLAKANNAKTIFTPPTWALFHDITTPHPLGGCRMADSAAQGVVDHRGEVFGYPGLYVADGSVIPCALGINPSRTIAALTERMCRLMLEEDRLAKSKAAAAAARAAVIN